MATINGTKDPKVSPKKKAPAKKKKAPAKKKAPKKKKAPGKTSKSAQGTTFKNQPGKPEEHTTEFVPTYCVEDGYLTANVNVSMGARVGLPDYSDARCGASLTIPVFAKPDQIDKAYEFAKEWCETRVQAMIDEIRGENV